MKFLHIWSIRALLGRKIGPVSVYSVSIGGTLKEYRLR